MAHQIPITEPSQLRAGDTWQWYRDLSDYPADGWILSYVLANSAAVETFAATAEGIRHLVDVDAETTADFAAGIYQWTASVSDGTDRYTIGTGTLQVLPDLAALTSGLDTRSHVKRVLDAIEAILEGRAAHDDLEVTSPDGRRLALEPRESLLKMRSRYQQEYAQELAAERLASGMGSGRFIHTRFR